MTCRMPPVVSTERITARDAEALVATGRRIGCRAGDPRWLVGKPAFNAKSFLSPEARAAGEAAQDLYLIQRDYRRWTEERR
jgi:hypothetical protein